MDVLLRVHVDIAIDVIWIGGADVPGKTENFGDTLRALNAGRLLGGLFLF